MPGLGPGHRQRRAILQHGVRAVQELARILVAPKVARSGHDPGDALDPLALLGRQPFPPSLVSGFRHQRENEARTTARPGCREIGEMAEAALWQAVHHHRLQIGKALDAAAEGGGAAQRGRDAFRRWDGQGSPWIERSTEPLSTVK